MSMEFKSRLLFGFLSLWGLASAAGFVLLSFIVPMAAPSMLVPFEVDGMASLIVGLYAGGIISIASLLSAIIGLARRERPRWPAILGLGLSLLPALGGVYLLCGAPW